MSNNFHQHIYIISFLANLELKNEVYLESLTLKPHVIHILQLDQGLHHVRNWYQQFNRLESLHVNGSDKIKRLPSNVLGFKSQEASQYQIFNANCEICAVILIKQFIVPKKINNFWSLAEWSY